jgi:hypothetical protein
MLAIDAEAPGPGDEEDEDEEAAEDGHVLHEELWWPGSPNKPDLCLLRIEPFTAEFWDGPASALPLLPSSSPRQGSPGRSDARQEPQGDGQDVSARHRPAVSLI